MLPKQSLLLAPQKVMFKKYRVGLFSVIGVKPKLFKFQIDQFNQS